MEIINPEQLDEEDILLWVEDTAARLRARDFKNLDIEHLIEKDMPDRDFWNQE